MTETGQAKKTYLPYFFAFQNMDALVKIRIAHLTEAMTNTDEVPFGNWNFSRCNLFEICHLGFVILMDNGQGQSFLFDQTGRFSGQRRC